MSELDGNVNINDVLQIIRFGGDGMKFMLKGTAKTAKAGGRLAKHGYTGAKYLRMQHQLKLHYGADVIMKNGELYGGLSLKRMEKLTGGNYGIINIPTENKQELAKFFKVLQKAKIPFSVLPDLIPNNGETQLAIDPARAHKLESILNSYNFSTGKIEKKPVPEESRGREMDIEEYWNSGNKEEKEKLEKAAVEQAEKEVGNQYRDSPMENPPTNQKSHMETSKRDMEKIIKFEKIREKHMNPNYIPFTIDKKMVVAETEKAYVTKVPKSFDRDSGGFMMMTIDKNNSVETNNGKTILTHLNKGGQTYICDSKRKDGRMVNNQELYRRHYSKYHTDFDRNLTKAKKEKKVKIYTPKKQTKK